MKQYVGLFRSLSNETRFRIMVLLSEKELCVCQIEEALGLSQVKVSRHLTVLKYAKLVNYRRDGLWIYYSIAKPKNCIEKVLYQCFKDCLHKDSSFKAELKGIKKCAAKRKNAVSKK